MNSFTRPLVVYLNMRRTATEQRSPLFAARQLGYDVLLLADRLPVDLPEDIVVTSREVNTTDEKAVVETIEELAGDHKVVAVATWSDTAVATAAAVAEWRGLRGLSREAAAVCRNKYLMRQALASHRPDLCPRYQFVRTEGEALKAFHSMTGPLILKPVSGSGSKGIFRVQNEADLRRAHAALTALVDGARDPIFVSHDGDLILEEFMEGTEHSVEGVIHDGRMTILGVTDKSTNEPFRLEVGHVFPSRLSAAALKSVHELTLEVVQSFEMDDCTFHLECIVSEHGRARLVECAGRGAGDFILSHLIGLSTGQPGCVNALRVALGEVPVSVEPYLYAGVRKVMATTEGNLSAVEGVGEALRVPGIEKIVLERAIGDLVELPPADFTKSVIGTVIATGGSAEELDRALEQAVSHIHPVIS